MPCTFCQIIAGERPAHVVLDDDGHMGFLDVRPLFFGHVLLVPRVHHETLVTLPAALVDPLFQRARLLARGMTEVFGAQGSFVAMNNTVSQSVPHLHIHVVPRTQGDGLRGFFWPRTKYGPGEAEAVAATLRAWVSAASGGDGR